MATRSKTHQDWLESITSNRRKAQAYAFDTSTRNINDVLARAASMLEDRLEGLDLDEDTFTMVAYRTILAQIKDVSRSLIDDMNGTLSDDAAAMAERAADDILDELEDAEESFSGLGDFAGLGIDEAMVFDRASNGANSSLLHRLEDDDDVGPGILSRYSDNTIEDFEQTLQAGLLSGASMDDIIDDLTDNSPFLQGNPRFWAERIARTESMNAYNTAGWESMRAVEDQTDEDMLKILCATFDDRTAADSHQVHGQVRRMDEPFEVIDYKGNSHFYMNPPGRPNDREVTVAWNPSWGAIPDELLPLSDDEVDAAFEEEIPAKASPPERPDMTTLDDMSGLWPDA